MHKFILQFAIVQLLLCLYVYMYCILYRRLHEARWTHYSTHAMRYIDCAIVYTYNSASETPSSIQPLGKAMDVLAMFLSTPVLVGLLVLLCLVYLYYR